MIFGRQFASNKMSRTLKYRKIRTLYMIACFTIVSIVFSMLQAGIKNINEGMLHRPESRHLLQTSNDTSLFQCIPSGFSAFPGDFFNQKQREKGGVIIHMLLAAYICAMIAEVCDAYFIPSLDIISDKMNLPPDVAGATFMAIGTSAPELFSSITGSFVTEGDIGVGTVIGSAVFNILAVTGVVGLVLWDQELDIDWYPIARDCSVYALTISCLIWIISDNVVTWWESLILLSVFALYIVIICYNRRIERWAKNMALKIKSKGCCCEPSEERTPILSQQIIVPELQEQFGKPRRQERDSFSVEFTASKEELLIEQEKMNAIIEEVYGEDEDSDGTLCSPPSGGPWSYVWWVIMYPASLVFFLTIPNIKSERFRKWYPITFLMSVIWIGVLSYMAVWMVTIVGYTFSIPDSVSGLTILAAGTSVPEIITSVIVARSGFGNMAISNLVGSNTFDISFCLGAPWLAKTLISGGYLLVYSSALTYTTATLLLTLVAFVLVFQVWKWKINRSVGIICFLIYTIFVILACLYELNVFGKINVQSCET